MTLAYSAYAPAPTTYAGGYAAASALAYLLSPPTAYPPPSPPSLATYPPLPPPPLAAYPPSPPSSAYYPVYLPHYRYLELASCCVEGTRTGPVRPRKSPAPAWAATVGATSSGVGPGAGAAPGAQSEPSAKARPAPTALPEAEEGAGYAT
ncbi:basic proline-rich protein-like [Solenopsis invicta]|uniref:basic proline-rich protein-like n=1 Tax=Solenopsis invicta TaxID=13686 RepID=UPI000595DC6B|nr:basic proline-rich protein-like [Solenopsis invicta]